MQPAPKTEDIEAILSRFQTWAEKHPANGNGNGHGNDAPIEELREIPYEEAIRRHRSRQTAQTQHRNTSANSTASATTRAKSTAGIAPNPPSHAVTQPAPEAPPQWIAELAVIPDTEPVIELKAAPTLPPETTAHRPPPPPG